MPEPNRPMPVPDDLTLIDEFRQALADELDAARRGPAADPVPLVDGRRVARVGERTRYRFTAERELPRTLTQDADVQLHLDDRNVRSTVVRVEGLDITLATEEDLGARIERAALAWDPTFLLEKLSKRLRERRQEDNRGGALLLRHLTEPGRFDEAELDGLNEDQERAVRRALASACTFIWGPPGTGKTQTIGRLVAELVRRGRSVLLVSHTNVAIDEALLRAADLLGDDLPDGRVLRFGPGYGPRLAGRPRLLAKTHVDERDADLAERIEHLRSTIEARWRDAEHDHRAVQLHDWAGALPRDLQRLRRLERERDRALRNLELVEQDIERRRARGSRLNGDLDRRRAQTTRDQAIDARRAHLDALCEVPGRYGLLDDAPERVTAEHLEAIRERVDDELDGIDIEAARARDAAAQQQLDRLEGQRRACERERERIEDDLVADAQVVACTLTAAYARSAIAGRTYDTVVIDEVSIAPIPAAWFAANLAERAVAAVGDFRQLAPIALAETRMANRWLKRDAFEASGIVDEHEAGRRPPELVALTRQHRMERRISELARRLAYGTVLQDAQGTDDDRELDPWFARGAGFDDPTTLVNLEPLAPWASTVRRGDRSSRLNVLSAAVTIDVVKRLLRQDRPAPDEGRRRVLVITPYRPQAELLGAMIRARRLSRDATAGTIHAFQGSEASVVVLDLTVAGPHYRAAIFDDGRNDEFRRLLNVAVTRARRRLVVVGDLGFVRERAKPTTPIRLLLRALIGSRELPAADLPAQAPQSLVERVVGTARDAVIWFVHDPNRERALSEQLRAVASRGVTVHVVGPQGMEHRLGIRSAATELHDAGAAVHVKRPLRESLLIVDGRFIFVRGRGMDGWSVWDDPRVAAQVARAHQVELIASLPDRHRQPGCDGVFVLGEGDHRSPGLYARCPACGASASSAPPREAEQASAAP
ncbi:MAG: AAA family ATPase [Solirubrobacteraceae bacterium]|nr:AAA family ATPase [Solirubrobacteraceae bacterium]